MKDDNVMIGCAVVFRHPKGRDVQWFIVKMAEDTGWEIPKTLVRRGESSVRSVIRLTQEQGSMATKVLEEIGRASGAGRLSGRVVNQKYIYYLMSFKDGGEILGFHEYKWVDYKTMVKLLPVKRDQNMMADAKVLLKEVEKRKPKKGEEEIDDDLALEETP